MNCIFHNEDCGGNIKYRMPLSTVEKSAALCEYHWTLRQHDVRVAASKECTCWEGYERVPGTKPCASGSCRKKSSLEKEGIAEILMPLLENSVRNGPYNKEYNKFWGPGGGGESWTVTMFDKHIGPLLDKIDERRKKKKEKETAETAVTTDE